MSDQSPGPGWWLASDGRWYPPEQAAAPAATPPPGNSFPPPSGPAWPPAAPYGPSPMPGPPGPPAEGGPGTTLAIVLGGLLTLVIVGALAVGLLRKDGDAEVGTEPTTVDDASTTTTARSSSSTEPTTTTTTSTTTTEAPVAVPDDFARVVDDVAGISLAIPPTWIAFPVRGDVAGLGARYAPDDPALAAAIDAGVGALPRQVVFFGLDTAPTGRAFVANLNVISVPRDGATPSDIEDLAAGAVETFGARDVAVAPVSIPAGPAVRVRYSLQAPNGISVRGEQYYVIVGEQVWIITFSTRERPPDPFAEMATSFTVG